MTTRRDPTLPQLRHVFDAIEVYLRALGPIADPRSLIAIGTEHAPGRVLVRVEPIADFMLRMSLAGAYLVARTVDVEVPPGAVRLLAVGHECDWQTGTFLWTNARGGAA